MNGLDSQHRNVYFALGVDRDTHSYLNSIRQALFQFEPHSGRFHVTTLFCHDVPAHLLDPYVSDMLKSLDEHKNLVLNTPFKIEAKLHSFNGALAFRFVSTDVLPPLKSVNESIVSQFDSKWEKSDIKLSPYSRPEAYTPHLTLVSSRMRIPSEQHKRGADLIKQNHWLENINNKISAQFGETLTIRFNELYAKQIP